jgi:hypothetical protein
MAGRLATVGQGSEHQPPVHKMNTDEILLETNSISEMKQ